MRKPKPATEASLVRRANGRDVPVEAIECANEAGLRYVADDGPGISRRRAGKGFAYFLPGGKRLTNDREIARCQQLAIPPAWTNVWICPLPNGHVQATGRDARGRKQYRYHADWRATRDEAKFERMIAFANVLPHIRRRVAADLRRTGLGRTKVLAAMVRLLETTLIRVGNEEYARDNRTYGLSTLRNRHVRVYRDTVHFRFTGKSGRRHEIDLHDPRLAEIVACLQDLPGQELFAYIDEQGAVQDVQSEDVNAYLRDAAGEEFSAKDFRTWAGTLLAARALAAETTRPRHRATRKNLAEVVKKVAEQLGNTPAVCRKCYIHPAVMDAYLRGEIVNGGSVISPRTARASLKLSAEERALLGFLARQAEATRGNLTAQLRRSITRTHPAKRGRKMRPGARRNSCETHSHRASVSQTPAKFPVRTQSRFRAEAAI